MSRVLVTGASGFIGPHLVEALVARGDEVTALVRKTSQTDGLESLGVALARGDVTDLESLRAAAAGKSTVYHLAGLTRALRARQFYEVNEQGIRNAAQTCADRPDPPVLVVVSSLAAAGPSPCGRLRTESDPPGPVSHYGRSKRAGEKAAEEFADRAPITVVRPPIVFGEGDTATLQMFKAVARSRMHLVPGYAPHRFSMIHAADLARLLILAAERGSRLPPPGREDEDPNASGYYFAACDEHPTYYQLGRMIGKALGRRRTLTIPFGTPVVRLVGAVGDLVGRAKGRQVVLNLDKAREATAGSWACSPEKARDELGFAVQVPLSDRLRQSAEWYREQGWL
ncbi:MAG TPA: NAD-dependent epimerase/dehydratase family protein [Thermoguttaceae bacterium]|nr:NAD-dependent epimerase/dehydratase family protein [Thermoguttaceae bacterium]